MSRRHYGSVRKLPSGRWQARYRDGFGQLVAAADTFVTKADAQRFLTRVEADQQRGSFIDPRAGQVSVDAWSAEWLRTKKGQRANTLARDRVALEYLLPVVGHLPIAAVTPLQIQSVVQAMRDLGRKPRTIRSYVGTYAALFAAAVEAEVIARSPVRRKLLNIGDPVESPHPHLAPPELCALAAEVPGWFGVGVLIGGALGLRWSEVVGLRVLDVDFLGRRLSVAQTVEEVAGVIEVVEATKSDASRRTIAVPSFITDALAAHLAEHRAGATGPDLCFLGPRGGVLRRNFGARHLAPAIAALELPAELTFHGLRHVAATYLEEVDAPLRVRQHRLGHSAQGVTLRTYTHVPEHLDRAVADRLGELFAGAAGQAAAH